MRLSIILILSLLFNSCDTKTTNSDDGTITPPPPAGDRNFWALDNTKDHLQLSSYYQVSSVLLYSNSKVNIYVEAANFSKVSTTIATDYGDQFRDLIQPTVTQIFGIGSDVNSDGKVNILFLDIRDGSTSPSSGFIGGYFFNADLFTPAEAEAEGARSNNSEILYIDCVENVINLTNISPRATIAHEFQHMVGYNQRFFVSNRTAALSSWINESLAEAAEYEVFGTEALSGRFSYIASNNFDKSASLEYWPASGSGSLSDYSLSSTYMNFVSNEFVTDPERFAFLKGIQNNVSADYNAVAINLSLYNGASIEKFKQSFYNYVSKGLVRVVDNAFPGVTKSNFSGIGFSDGSNHSDRGFVPRVLKYNKDASVTLSGSQFKLFDVSESAYTENTIIDSLKELDGLGYSAALVFSPSTTDDFFNFSITTPLPAKRAKDRILPNSAYRKGLSLNFELKR